MWHWLINIVTAWLIFSLARYRTKLIVVSLSLQTTEMYLTVSLSQLQDCPVSNSSHTIDWAEKKG